MKKTDKISYRQKGKDELSKLLIEAKKKLVETRAKHTTGNLKDTSLITKIRYEISLISTLLTSKSNEKQNG